VGIELDDGDNPYEGESVLFGRLNRLNTIDEDSMDGDKS